MQRKLTILLLLLISGCSIQKFAVRSMSDIMDNGFVVLNEESDLELAEKSIASNLKLLEAMKKSDPNNKDLLQLLCTGYTSYALGFVEDTDVERAKIFYLRAKEFGIELLKQNKHFDENATLANFENSLSTFKKSDIPALFWTAIAWGSYISLNLTQPEALADLPKVEAIMKFIIKTDENYYYGGAHFFLGALYGSRPKIFGGNPEESKKHFDKCLSINEGKFLMTYVYYAKTYAVQIQDPVLFQDLLGKIDEMSEDVLPEARLSNVIAKKKAEILRNKFNELF